MLDRASFQADHEFQECFQIDESGYTGFDLLNNEQRFQGASAVAINDAEAAQLIREYFPRLQAPELKYKQAASRPSYRQGILDLHRTVLSRYKCVTYICDKRYLLTLMFLDHAVEPFYYERGINFYEHGQNVALASALYLAGPDLFGQNEFEALLANFQNAVKEKTPAALEKLVLAARNLDWKKFPIALGPIANASQECLDSIVNPGVTTDAAIVVLMSLVNRMELLASAPYRVAHDQSKNLLRYNNLLQQLIGHEESVDFRASDIAHFSFPLKLSAVNQVDSKASPAVQIADILIGAATEAANALCGVREASEVRLDPQAVYSLYTEEQLIHLVPTRDFDAEMKLRKDSRSAELIDYLARCFGNAF